MLDSVGIPSPTNSSVSSSDLDTQSTGSFFRDRSTSLGTLMGVHFPTLIFRTPLSTQTQAASQPGGGRKKQRKKINKKTLVLGTAAKGRRWWSICRDTDDAKPGSLGEFLEVERCFGDPDNFYGTMEGEMTSEIIERGVLFSDGRVLPPVAQVEESPSTTNAVFCGICCSTN